MTTIKQFLLAATALCLMTASANACNEKTAVDTATLQMQAAVEILDTAKTPADRMHAAAKLLQATTQLQLASAHTVYPTLQHMAECDCGMLQMSDAGYAKCVKDYVTSGEGLNRTTRQCSTLRIKGIAPNDHP